jgi:CDGSH-type Zn-finger protein
VFDPKARPWARPDEGDPNEIVATVAACPSGALGVERLDGGDPAPVPEVATVRVEADGPLYVTGRVRIRTRDDATIATETRLALCRCGRSSIKPFCDGSHSEGFTAGDDIAEGKAEVDASATGELTITVAPDRPLRFHGPFRWANADGTFSEPCTEGALCRCGLSNRKPHCDGAHREAGIDRR